MPRDNHEQPGLLEMIGEVVDVSAGLGVVLLPLLVTALPGVILLLVLPALLLAAPLVIGAALAVPPVLLVRSIRRRRRRAGPAGVR